MKPIATTFMSLKRLPRFRVLALESSFDDTCLAVVDSNKNILYSKVLTQKHFHAPFKGVVPSLTKSVHDSYLHALLSDVPSMTDIEIIAATKGPGLSPALSTGYQLGKQLAAFLKVPFLEINHMVSLSEKFLGSPRTGNSTGK